MWIDVGLLLFLSLLGAVCFGAARRSDPGAATLWTWACIDILGSGLCTVLASEARWSLVVGYALGTAYPALLLVGALAYTGREPRRWLIPSALAAGAVRAWISLAGWSVAAQTLALLVEPPMVLAAAWIVWRAPRPEAAGTQLALASVLLGFVGLEAATALVAEPGVTMPTGILGLWVLGAPLLLVLQVAATSDRSQDILRRSRDELERRVADRTAELAASVGELEQQVAERRAAERALRESEERYRLVSELSSDYSFAIRIDPVGQLRYEWATGALSRITGYGEDEINGEGWLELIPPRYRHGARERLRELATGDSPSVDVRILTKQGEERWLNVRVATVSSESDGITRMVGAARDVTEQRLAERERKRLDRHVAEAQRLESLGLLAGGIAHDFNNLLTVMLGNTRLALEELDPSSSVYARIERVRSAARLAAGLTEQILTHAGQGPVEREPLDLSQLIHDMLDLLRTSLGPKGTLEPQLAPGLPAVDGDPSRLRQVLLNLVGNAAAALGEGNGSVAVRTGLLRAEPSDLEDTFGTPDPQPGLYVTLEVSDDGCGMDPEVQERIFEPFFTTRQSGRGLGLATVLGIIRAHNGLIRIHSEQGVGTSIHVLLPASDRTVTAPAPVLPDPAPAGGRVLVVDDDDAVVELAREFLSRAGFQVTSAESGEAALAAFRAAPDAIDAVVIDLSMPGLGGAEALAALRRLRPGLPAVVASGFDREHVASRISETGASAFLAKPYAPEQLVGAVARVLGGG